MPPTVIPKEGDGIDLRHSRGCRYNDNQNHDECTCSPTYRARAYDAQTGRRIPRTFPTYGAAKRWKEDAASALRSGDMSADAGPTLREAWEEWYQAAQAGVVTNRSGKPYKPATLRAYEKSIRRRVLDDYGNEYVRKIKLSTMQRLADQLAIEGLSPSTVSCTFAPLYALFKRLRRLDVITHDPIRGISLPSVSKRHDRFATVEQVEAILAKLKTAKDRACWATAYYAGLRRGELFSLRRSDIKLGSGIIHVQRGWDPEEGEIEPKSEQGNRKVPIPTVLRDYLVAYLMDGPEGEERLFTEGWTTYRNGRKAAKAAEVEPLTFHECRHGYASLMIAAGVNIKALSTFMGHANIKITLDKYGHLLPGAEDEAASLLDAFLARQVGAAEGTEPAREEVAA